MKRLTLLLLFGIILSLSMVNAAWSDTLNSNLLAYWTFNETTGNIIDRYDFNNNFTQFLGSYNRNSNGIIGGSDQYSADSGVLNMTQMVGINSSKVGTISFWINSTAIGNNLQYAVSTFQGTSSFTFEFDNRTGLGSRMMFTFGSDWQVTTLNGSLSMLINNWTHIALVQDGSYPVIYVNGKNYTGYYLNKADTTTWLDDLNLGFLGLGYLPGGYTRLNVSFDEMGIWNRSLSASEIETLYNSGNGITYSPTTFTINLNLPTDNSAIDSTNYTFNSSLDPKGENLVNATIEIWYSNGTLFNSTTNIITGTTENHTLWTINNFTLGDNMTWNVFGCTSSQCKYSGRNFTFLTASILEDYPTTLVEGQGTTMSMNITFSNINTDILAILTWNNTNYAPVKNVIGNNKVVFSSTFVVPTGIGNSTGRLVDHYWRYYLPDGSLNKTTTAKTQQVYTFGIDDCTTQTELLLNYTLYDEDTLALLNISQNTSIEVEVIITSIADPTKQISFNQTYNDTNNALICVNSNAINSSGYRIDSQAKYYSENYVTEFYNIQNSTLSNVNYPQHIKLYDLLTTKSQEFLITFKDDTLRPTADALITITRKYIGEGLFRTVEAPLTNTDGQALVHLVLSNEVYTIQISKNGILLATFDNIIPFCDNVATGDCKLNLNAFSTGIEPEDYLIKGNMSYYMYFDESTKTVSTIFSSIDSSIITVGMNVTLYDNYGNTTICTDILTSSSGTLTCIIPSTYGNSTIFVELYKNGNFINSAFYTIKTNVTEAFGLTGYLFLLLLYITIPMMMITTGIGIVIGAIIGLIFAALLNLYEGGGFIGIGSTLLWFIIAGGILIWKINQRNQ